MTQELVVTNYAVTAQQINTGALVLGAGLALTSMILVPALAMRLGLSASLTGALRIALMKASSRAASFRMPEEEMVRQLRLEQSTPPSLKQQN
jgi:hypothetical protein